MKSYKIYIDGQWIESMNKEQITVTNPATGEVVGYVPKVGETETKKAIDAANNAFKSWSTTTASERANYLWKLYHLLLENKEDIARTMTMEQGKPLQEAIGEVMYAAGFVQWYAEEARRVYGETIPASKENKRIRVLKQAVGVVAAITPWNFPAAMITRKLAPALAAGCTMVIKPASQTPITAIKIMDLCEKAGFPKGVVNLVTGNANEIGKTIMSDFRVRKLTFTGSTEVGKILMGQAGETVKRISLELGGHAPFIAFEDADLDKAVTGALASKLRNCGQVCVASNRFYIQESIVDKFIEKIKSKLADYRVGNGLEEGVNLGPLIDESVYNKVEKHIEDAVNKGAKIEFGGKGSKAEGNTPGHFLQPTLLSNVTEDMLIMKEETFGPVIPVLSFKSEEEVIERANNTNYGLAAYFYTESLARSIRVSEALDYGIVGVNDGSPSTPEAPFGGFKESGLGREGGHHGIEGFLETKYVSVQI
ncbi:NAD-dependent succinate-semialdehyde dehydrogenase [Serpentinicella sp. ANB-PHB4]|uniref:NAD-dependent succinate-semialdehyde dehydrogenase n=1 Tax=Serpentinicella sp. ANB-PHB4 TaxID=3074076 RepID=UPI002855AF7A|nr:NAD-dependent succinate-semialdehyde dehydrogenase [Serpentinicella sp. ANB-PHB4]MDR5659790.1 NAD-dependent succinate-semialdehyde dehydrogenase [Serpentinicella sp. ANB-PHB4]